MRRILIVVLSLFVVLDGIYLFRHRASTSSAAAEQNCASASADAQAIEQVLTQQAADWNRGDLDAFATGYKNSPDILFMGHKTSRGYDGMLATYKQTYSSREKMGTLTFSQLEVQPLDAHFATTTGHFHLERIAAGGGNADGYFLSCLKRLPQAGRWCAMIRPHFHLRRSRESTPPRGLVEWMYTRFPRPR